VQNESVVQFNSFVGGLNTEASQLNYPPNASLDEDNMVLLVDGTRRRRKGVNTEVGGASRETATAINDSKGFQFFRWDNAGGDATKSIGVVKVSHSLYFIDMFHASPSSAAARLNGGTPIEVNGWQGHQQLDFTTCNGHLIIAADTLPYPLLLSLEDGSAVTSKQLVLQTRDVWGVDDGAYKKVYFAEPTATNEPFLSNRSGPNPIDYDGQLGLVFDQRYPRVVDATDSEAAQLEVATYRRYYNLRNQGWSEENLQKFADSSADAGIGTDYYPSNVDLASLGQAEDSDANTIFKAANVINALVGSTPAPRGKFIIDIGAKGRSRIQNLLGYYRPLDGSELSTYSNLYFAGDQMFRGSRTVASHFGRVFYAGWYAEVVDPESYRTNTSNVIFYTKQIQNPDDFEKCYQEADPTSAEISDVIDTDGGFLSIPEMGAITKLVPLNNQLIILAENGIWSVAVADGAFSPTNYSVTKITEVGADSPKSVVVVEGSVMFWNSSGIYGISLNDISQKAVARDITVGTIKTLYSAINGVAKQSATGYYDSINKTVGWLYSGDSTPDPTNLDKYNKELIYDLTLKAFYTNTHSSQSTYGSYVVGAVKGQVVTQSTTPLGVVVDGVAVTADSTAVSYPEFVRQGANTRIKYLTYSGASGGLVSFTLSDYNDSGFLDWGTEDYSSYLVTGHSTFGDIARTKGVPYLFTHFIRTETGFSGSDLDVQGESSCLVQARWEWTNSSSSNRWGTAFQAYRYKQLYVPSGVSDTFSTGYDLISTKNKLRGRGKSISLYMASERGKDMYIAGWAMYVVGSTRA